MAQPIDDIDFHCVLLSLTIWGKLNAKMFYGRKMNTISGMGQEESKEIRLYVRIQYK